MDKFKIKSYRKTNKFWVKVRVKGFFALVYIVLIKLQSASSNYYTTKANFVFATTR